MNIDEIKSAIKKEFEDYRNAADKLPPGPARYRFGSVMAHGARIHTIGADYVIIHRRDYDSEGFCYLFINTVCFKVVRDSIHGTPLQPILDTNKAFSHAGTYARQYKEVAKQMMEDGEIDEFLKKAGCKI